MRKFNLSVLITGFMLFSMIFTATAQSQTNPMQNAETTIMKRLGPADQYYDLRYLEMMIQHHQTAIRMSQDAVTKARHPELRQMAQDIITNQSREVAQMDAWRKYWYNK